MLMIRKYKSWIFLQDTLDIFYSYIGPHVFVEVLPHPFEDHMDIPVSVKVSRLSVQQSHDIFYYDVVFIVEMVEEVL